MTYRRRTTTGAADRCKEGTLKEGLHEFADALANCLNALLDRDSAGFGNFNVSATREARDRVRLHIDGGIYSCVSNIVGEGVRVDVVPSKDGSSVTLRLRPYRRTAA